MLHYTYTCPCMCTKKRKRFPLKGKHDRLGYPNPVVKIILIGCNFAISQSANTLQNTGTGLP